MNRSTEAAEKQLFAGAAAPAELPLVTIITPSYNRAGLLTETIESVLCQDYPNIEYIIINDGSTDDTKSVLSRYENRAKIIQKANTGENRTVNMGFSLAAGKYICVVNSDDPILKYCVSRLVTELELDPRAVIAYGDYAIIGPNHEFLKYERLRKYTTENMLETLNFGLGPGMLIRRSAITRYGLRREEYRYAGDMEFCLRMSLHGSFNYVPEVLATHRVHPDSLSVKTARDRIGREVRDAFTRTINDAAFPSPLHHRRRKFLHKIYHAGRISYATSGREKLRLWLIELFWLHSTDDFQNFRLRAIREAAYTATDIGVKVLRLFFRPGRPSSTVPPARFAFSTRFLPPLWSGQAVVIRRLLTGIDPSVYRMIGHPVGPLHDTTGDYIGALTAGRYELPPVKQLRVTSQARRFWRTVNLLWGIWQRGLQIVSAIRNDRPDLLIACTGDQMDPPATWLAAKFLRCRFCMYFFDEFGEQWWADRTIFPIIKAIERFLVLRSDLLIAPNEFMARKLLIQYGAHCEVVPNPMPTSELPPVIKAFPADRTTVKLVFTGAVYHLNYAAFEAINVAISTMTDMNAELHIYTAQSHEQIASEGVSGPKVKLHRHLRPEEVVRAQSEADILLIPFNDDPDCLELVRTSATAKLADYLATGRPLLALCPKDSFLAWYIVRHGCGVTVSTLSRTEIQDAIRKIAFDAELREKLRCAARLCAKRDFDPNWAAQKLRKIIGVPDRGPSLKIVQISGFDLLGIQVNGYLLHEYFRNAGHESHMYVHHKYSSDENVEQIGTRWLSRANGHMTTLQNKLSLWSFLPVEAVSLLFRRTFYRADIVHLQLVHNAQFFSLLILPLLSWLKRRGRLILSIHDMFLFTGHCIYSLDCQRWKTGCGSCPHFEIPFPIQHDLTRFSWVVKWIVFKLATIELVVGSPWQHRHVKMSPILRHLPVHYIPYGVDTRVFFLRDKSACRARFGIPNHADVISFRSVPFSKNFKGTEYIIEALKLYQPKKKTYLLTLEGVGGLDVLKDKYEIIHLAWTNDDRDLIADVLNAADIFLMPSIAEAFGLMAVESLACGTPVIVFDGTALPETIDAPNCGLAVPMKDHMQLSQAIGKLLGAPEYRQQLASNGLKYVKDKHTFEMYANNYLDLYRQLLHP